MEKYITEKYIISIINSYAELNICDLVILLNNLHNQLCIVQSEYKNTTYDLAHNISNIIYFNIYCLTKDSLVLFRFCNSIDKCKNIPSMYTTEIKFNNISKKICLEILEKTCKFYQDHKWLHNPFAIKKYEYNLSYDQLIESLSKYDIEFYNIILISNFFCDFEKNKNHFELFVRNNNVFHDIQNYFKQKIIKRISHDTVKICIQNIIKN